MAVDERNAIVTGSARGIGRAIAVALARAGYGVCLVDVLERELDDAVAAIGAALGTAPDRAEEADIEAAFESDGPRSSPSPQGRRRPPVGRVADITNQQAVSDMVEFAEAQLGPVDLLVNNAGTFSVVAPVWESDPELWFRDVRTNLFGTYLVMREILARMVRRRSGRIVNLVSSGGVGDPHPYSTSYAASKTGLMRLTEGAAAEAAEYGIAVFALAPPAVDTAMARFIRDDPGGRRWRPGFDKLLSDSSRTMTPGAVAAKVLALADGSYDFLSGRFVSATADFDELAAAREEVEAQDYFTLRIRRPR